MRLLRLLAERGISVVEVPDEEFESQGSNVLALGPRRALALDGNPETRQAHGARGVDVAVYRGDEISRKGDGGPTCLTRPLLRDLRRRARAGGTARGRDADADEAKRARPVAQAAVEQAARDRRR